MDPRRERVVLEPDEVALPGRIEIDIHHGEIQVGEQGPDWGEYEINAFLAKREMGEISIDEEIPNRKIELPLVLGASGDFDAARIAVQAWAANVNHNGGGHLKREIIGGSYGEAGKKLFADCVKATLKFGGGSSQARDGVDDQATLTIEALPDFYGDRIEFEPFEGTGDAAKTFQIKGNLPGRAEILVEEKSGRNQLAVPWHFRCRDYSAEAPWAMNVSTFERFGTAAEATVAGSIATKVVQHSNLGTSWTPVAAKTIKHTGLNEVLVRVYTTSEEPPEVRLLSDVGDLVNPNETQAMKIPGRNGFYIIRLGLVNLEQLPIGTHQARILLQARGTKGGENVAFDRMWFLSAADSSGTPTAPRRISEGLSAPLVFDGFNQAGGAATGQSPAVGSAYVAVTNSDTDDFEIDAANHVLTRSSTKDSGTIINVAPGRGIGAGTAKRTNFGIAVDVDLPYDKQVACGFLTRWVNAENFIWVWLRPPAVGEGWWVSVNKYKAKAISSLGPAAYITPSPIPLVGRLAAIHYEDEVILTFDGEELLSVQDPDLAPGQLLGEGRAYLYDDSSDAGVLVRKYDNFEIWTPSFEAVNFANQKAWLSYKGLYRMGAGGTAYGPIAKQNSDLPRVPVSGPEERPVELAVKTSRGDLEAVQDSGNADKFVVRFGYRPCWSSVPGL